MTMDADEIKEEIAHQQALIREYKKHLRVLELQSASFGLSCPPHIITEIDRLKSKIREFELERVYANSTTIKTQLITQLGNDIVSIEHALSNVETREERVYKFFGIPVFTVSVVVS